MPEPLATLTLNHATLELWPEHVRTVFPDGATVPAAPNEGETIVNTAVHEFLHHALAEAMTDEPSHCLRAVAEGDAKRWTPERLAEEKLAHPVGLRMAELFNAMQKAYGGKRGASSDRTLWGRERSP